jgi:hypothetical protein
MSDPMEYPVPVSVPPSTTDEWTIDPATLVPVLGGPETAYLGWADDYRAGQADAWPERVILSGQPGKQGWLLCRRPRLATTTQAFLGYDYVNPADHITVTLLD